MSDSVLAIVCPGCGARYATDGLEVGARYGCQSCPAELTYDPGDAVAVEPGALAIAAGGRDSPLTISPDRHTDELTRDAGLPEAPTTERIGSPPAAFVDEPRTERMTGPVEPIHEAEAEALADIDLASFDAPELDAPRSAPPAGSTRGDFSLDLADVLDPDELAEQPDEAADADEEPVAPEEPADDPWALPVGADDADDDPWSQPLTWDEEHSAASRSEPNVEPSSETDPVPEAPASAEPTPGPDREAATTARQDAAMLLTGNDFVPDDSGVEAGAPTGVSPAPGIAADAPRSLGGVGRRAASEDGGVAWTFSRYEILEEIGRGGMGIVYKANDPTLKRIVAIKTLIGGPGAEGAALRRFEREAITIAKLSHPNLVPVYEYGEFDGTRFLAMEYVEGTTLNKLAKGTQGNLRFAVQTVAKVARALDYAHERGIVHRDLKPANVMIGADREPRVMDFGLAKDQGGEGSELSRTGDIMGTPNYMSPEQADGRVREIDRRSDVFSLGAILYELVTGSTPFGGSSLAETLRQVLYEDPPPMRALNPEVDDDLEAVVLRALEKRPEDRYPTAAALADDLEAYAAGKSVVTQKPSMAVKARRRMGRPSRSVLVAVIVLLVAAIAGGGAMWYLRDPLADQRERLADADPSVRLAAIRSLDADLGAGRVAVTGPDAEGDVLGLVLEAVGDDDPDVRIAALGVLKRIGPDLRDDKDEALDDRITDAVLPSVADDQPVAVRMAALDAIESAYLRAAEKPLLRIARSPFEEQRVQLRAVEVLGEIGRVTAMSGLLAVQERGGVYRVHARAAIERIEERGQGGVDDDPEAVNIGDLPSAMRDMASSVSLQRDRQAEALEEMGLRDSPEDEGAVLERDLETGSQAAKLAALEGLRERGADAHLAALTARLGDLDEAVARRAAEVMAEVGGAEVRKIFRVRLVRGGANERAAAAYGLGRMGGRESMDLLLDAFSQESSPSVRVAIIQALGICGERMAAPHLIGLLEDPYASIRSEAQRALANLAGKDLGPDADAWLEWWKDAWRGA